MKQECILALIGDQVQLRVEYVKTQIKGQNGRWAFRTYTGLANEFDTKELFSTSELDKIREIGAKSSKRKSY